MTRNPTSDATPLRPTEPAPGSPGPAGNPDTFTPLKQRLSDLDWRKPVPDELQSEIRMLFNEALAGGPNMNGDGGPTLTVHHALDCIYAAEVIAELRRST